MFDKEVVGGGAREVGGREGVGFKMTWKGGERGERWNRLSTNERP